MHHLLLHSATPHFAHSMAFRMIFRVNSDYFPKQHQPIIFVMVGGWRLVGLSAVAEEMVWCLAGWLVVLSAAVEQMVECLAGGW
jgi:hypothetical protein